MIPGKFLKDAMIPMHLLAQAMAKLPPISERPSSHLYQSEEMIYTGCV
jgi:hypothetical protein